MKYIPMTRISYISAEGATYTDAIITRGMYNSPGSHSELLKADSKMAASLCYWSDVNEGSHFIQA